MIVSERGQLPLGEQLGQRLGQGQLHGNGKSVLHDEVVDGT